ncbi:MAG: phosphoserine phosphatase SerB [Kiloniellales bacterium]
MSFVLTFIGNPADRSVDNQAVAAARQALQARGATCGDPDWLAEGVACDLAFTGLDPGDAAVAVRAPLDRLPVDVAIQPDAGRRKRLLVADMDSTIVSGETLDELAAEAGLEDRIAPITARAMRGEIDFAQAVRRRVAMLTGLPLGVLERSLTRLRLEAGAVALVRTMRAHGAHTVLVSGGFDFFTGRVRRMAGFDEDLANRLKIRDGALTGGVVEPIFDRRGKADALRRIAGARGFSPAETLAVGDGANDLEMIEAAGLGVAFRAKPMLAARAQVRIDHGDLTAVLYLQGYRASEILA